ncbi:MAG: tetratricopeptide repeat protein [Candidatus Kryptoniota bacterium]
MLEIFAEAKLERVLRNPLTTYILLLIIVIVQTSSLLAQESQVDSDFKFGIELYKNKMYDLAEEQFTRYLQLYPTSSSAGQARYYLALTELELRKYPNAASNFQTFAVQFPNDPLAPDAWMKAGETYAYAHEYANAGFAFERLRVFYPKDQRAPDALLRAAKYFKLAGDTSRAEQSLMTLVQEYSSSPLYYAATYDLGNLYVETGKTVNAEAEFKSLLTSDNDSIRVMGLLALGKLYRSEGDFAAASKYFNQAVDLNIIPQSTDALLESISLDIEAGSYDNALNRLSQISESQLSAGLKSKLKYEKAYCYLAKGDFDSYRKVLPSASHLTDEEKRELAHLLDQNGEFEMVHEMLSQISPKGIEIQDLILHAKAEFMTDNFYSADSLLVRAVEMVAGSGTAGVVNYNLPQLVDRLLEIDANNITDHHRLEENFNKFGNLLIPGRVDSYLFYKAIVDEWQEQFAPAVINLDSLVETYPESDYVSDADSIRDYLQYFKMVNYNNAVVHLSNLMLEKEVSMPTTASMLIKLGEIYYDDLKDYNKSIEVFDKLARVSQGDTARFAQFMIARCNERLSHIDESKISEAISIYQKISAPSESDTIAEKSLITLARLYYERGDTASARSAVVDFLSRFPKAAESPDAYLLLARILYKSHSFYEALSQVLLAGSAPEAKLLMAKIELSLDSAGTAKKSLLSLLNKNISRKIAVEANITYARALVSSGEDPSSVYHKLLNNVPPSGLVPSEIRNDVAEEYGDYLYTAGKFDSAYSIYSKIASSSLWESPSTPLLEKMANCKLKSGDLNIAKAIFQKIVATAEDSSTLINAYTQLGAIYKKLGDERLSASFYLKAGESDPDAMIKAADTYFNAADYKEARRVYSQILSKSVSDSLRQYAAAQLIRIDYLTDNIKSADAGVTQFKKNYPDADKTYFARFLLDRSKLLISNKQYDEARKLLEKIGDDYEETIIYPASLLELARIDVETGNLDKAQKKLEDILSKFPYSTVAAEAHLELGNIYYAKEKYQNAIDNYRVIYLDTTSSENIRRSAMDRLISSYESVGMYDAALEVTKKFILEFPTDPNIMDKKIKVGILYEELKYYDQALATFQSLLKEANRDYLAELHYYIGAIYVDKGDYANSILEFLKVPYLVPGKTVVDWAANAYYMAGKSYEKLNRPQDAIAMYQKIIDKPDTDPAFKAGAEREINRVKALLK